MANIGDLSTFYKEGPYIHSTEKNYIASSMMLEKSQVMSDFRTKIIPMIKGLRDDARILESLFYLDMGVVDARDFSNKFLLSGAATGDSEIIKKIGSILNTLEFRNLLLGAYGYEETLLKNLQKVFKNSPLEYNEFAILQGEELVRKVFALDKAKRGSVLGTGPLDTPRKKWASKSLQDYIIKNFKENDIKKELKNDSFGEKMKKMCSAAEKYLTNELIKLDVDVEQAKQLGKNLYVELAKIMTKDENRIGEIDIFSNPKGATGFIAEVVWGFDPGITNIESKVVGRQTHQTGKQTGKKIGSDIRITGKSGRQYWIQSKNTFYSRGPIYSGGGSLKSIIEKLEDSDAFSTTDPKYEIDLLKYNLLNSKIFNMAGGLKQVSQVLSAGILHFLGIETFEKLALSMNSLEPDDASNLFYIYKGTYLIPFSDFLDTVCQLLEQVEGLFKINPSDIKIDTGLDSFKDSLWRSKEVIMEQNPKTYPGQFPLGGYSDDMLALGRDSGNYLVSITEINNIKIFAKQIQMLIEKAMKTPGR